jgi:hypothetical protein
MIDKTRIVSRGDVAKFKIEITHADFDQQTDNFYVVLTWGMFNQSMKIEHADIKHDEDGNFFIVFDSSDMLGLVKAACHYVVQDSDIKSGYREEVNYQWLCFVTADPTARFCYKFEPGGDGHVVYTRVYAGDVNTAYANLRDCNQQNLLDSDGRQLRVHKTGKDLQDYYEDK